jgi:Protein of unknown function (DUF3631)
MILPPPNICQRMRALHSMLGSPNVREAETAREKLLKLLAEHGLTWNDLPAVLAATAAADTDSSRAGAAASAAAVAPTVNVLDLILALMDEHIAITAQERMAAALWVLHTYVFDRFPITPRLALLSPVKGCGKTTVILLLEQLVAEPYRSDNITAAAIYYLLDRRPRTTLLIDEGDNLDLLNNAVFRAVFNSGHRRGGGIDRVVGGRLQKFKVYAPLAVAAIGLLPSPQLHRSIALNMQRAGGIRPKLFDEGDPAFVAAREEFRKWAATCSLAPDPEMPTALRNREADNWRVLLSIADDLGHGEAARSAAVTLCANRPDEDPGVTLLADIRTAFQELGVERIASSALVEALIGLDDGLWNEWRGPHDDGPPRTLTQGELSRLLRPFGIRPKTVWPARRRLGDRSSRGYLRSQFDAAWRAYCPPADTPTQSSRIIQLPRL